MAWGYFEEIKKLLHDLLWIPTSVQSFISIILPGFWDTLVLDNNKNNFEN